MTEQTLGQIVMDALAMRDQLKADGLSGAALDQSLETVLRETWPKPIGRTEPWHDTCAHCRDYGLSMGWCPGDATCGDNPVTSRPRKPHAPHEYGKPCWCTAGRRHLDKPVPNEDDAMTLAARPKKPTRWGR